MCNTCPIKLLQGIIPLKGGLWCEKREKQHRTQRARHLYRELSHTGEAAIVNRGKKNKTGDKDTRFLLALMFAPV